MTSLLLVLMLMNTSVELEEGANVITIVSEAANAVDMKTYTLTVTRAAASASDECGAEFFDRACDG